KSNEREAAVVGLHVRRLVAAGVRPEDVAVITPYNGQVALLSRALKHAFPALELGSVDGFQGREKEAVVLSLVRSNGEGEVGFLGERRRLNGKLLLEKWKCLVGTGNGDGNVKTDVVFTRAVAMTRARRHLCVVGDSETVGRGSDFLKRWMEFLEENADLRYPDPAELNDDDDDGS
ncbi:hypothetical protein LTR28_009418, partial [Elasticomyces elasticus]